MMCGVCKHPLLHSHNVPDKSLPDIPAVREAFGKWKAARAAVANVGSAETAYAEAEAEHKGKLISMNEMQARKEAALQLDTEKRTVAMEAADRAYVDAVERFVDDKTTLYFGGLRVFPGSYKFNGDVGSGGPRFPSPYIWTKEDKRRIRAWLDMGVVPEARPVEQEFWAGTYTGSFATLAIQCGEVRANVFRYTGVAYQMKLADSGEFPVPPGARLQ